MRSPRRCRPPGARRSATRPGISSRRSRAKTDGSRRPPPSIAPSSIDPSPTDLVPRLAERAVRFHDEWVDDGAATLQLLCRLAELDPAAEPPFERLSLLYTVAARWEELIALYDRAIAASAPPERRARLLGEAARVAKDCAGQPALSVRYLEQLFALRPGDAQLVAALERLLRQQGRYRELIEVWERRLPFLDRGEAAALRAVIAGAWLTHLHDPKGALEAAGALLDDPASTDAVCELLGRVVAARDSDDEVRRRAAGLLRERYDAAGRWEEMVAALESMLPFEPPGRRAAVHAEIARRLIEHGRETAARPHLAALLVLDAENWDDEAVLGLLAADGASSFGPLALSLDEASARSLVEEAAALAVAGASPASSARAEALYRALLETRPGDLAALGALAPALRGLWKALGAPGPAAPRARARPRPANGGCLSAWRSRGSCASTATRPRKRPPCARTSPRRAGTVRRSTRSPGSSGPAGGTKSSPICSPRRPPPSSSPSTPKAAALWTEAAAIAEARLGAVDRVVRYLERAVNVAETPESLDALARLEAARGRHAKAVAWLERRLVRSAPAARTPTVLRLAEALLAAGQSARARGVLERGRAEDPGSVELLSTLSRCLRAAGAFAELADALEAGLDHIREPAAIVAFRREAAAVLLDPLGDPARAERVLRPALKLAPDDRGLRVALADTLRASGHLDEAAATVTALVAEYGKRRPPERAALHFLRARILEAQDRTADAIAEPRAGRGHGRGARRGAAAAGGALAPHRAARSRRSRLPYAAAHRHPQRRGRGDAGRGRDRARRDALRAPLRGRPAR